MSFFIWHLELDFSYINKMSKQSICELWRARKKNCTTFWSKQNEITWLPAKPNVSKWFHACTNFRIFAIYMFVRAWFFVVFTVFCTENSWNWKNWIRIIYCRILCHVYVCRHIYLFSNDSNYRSNTKINGIKNQLDTYCVNHRTWCKSM